MAGQAHTICMTQPTVHLLQYRQQTGVSLAIHPYDTHNTVLANLQMQIDGFPRYRCTKQEAARERARQSCRLSSVTHH